MKKEQDGTLSTLLGVLIFSGSLPATRVAILGFSPLFLTAARAVIAAVLGAALLRMAAQRLPARGDLPGLLLVSVGAVLGFPLLTALALQYVTAAHSLVFIGLLPLSTAAFGVLFGGERPKWRFWLFSLAGAMSVVVFALSRGGAASWQGDLLMLAAVVICGLAYAQGAVLSRRLGGWQVISWALLVASPPMVVLAAFTYPTQWASIPLSAWVGLAYVSVFSMLIGFVFWYRGMVLSGTARASQMQLLQPFMGLVLAGLLLHEPIAGATIAVAAFIVGCVVMARRYA